MTGEGFVSFASPEKPFSAQKAKDRSTLGNRHVKLFHTTPEELVRSVTSQKYQQKQNQPGSIATGKSSASVAISSITSSEKNAG
ncbi:hypothetical protein VYU27_008383 [Nannochloropsis oceanica]